MMVMLCPSLILEMAKVAAPERSDLKKHPVLQSTVTVPVPAASAVLISAE